VKNKKVNIVLIFVLVLLVLLPVSVYAVLNVVRTQQYAASLSSEETEEYVQDFSTFFGGSGQDSGMEIEVDSQGYIYVSGVTRSTDFPYPLRDIVTMETPNKQVDATYGDVFVSKFSPDCQTLLATYIVGGSTQDDPWGMALDSQGNVFVTGYTSSTDFPVVNAVQPIYGGGDDTFVFKLKADFSRLLFSTYLGGSHFEEPGKIAVYSDGSALVVGNTQSDDFPTVGGGGKACPTTQGEWDVYVAKFSADGNSLELSTCFGGKGSDYTWGMKLHEDKIYVAGTTGSDDLPVTPGVIQDHFNGGFPDAFFAKLSINYAPKKDIYLIEDVVSYLGGAQYYDEAWDIDVDNNGSIVIAGITTSEDFPVYNALAPSWNGWDDFFITKVTPDASEFIYSTYLGGIDFEKLSSIDVLTNGDVYIFGKTQSPDYPTKSALQPEKTGLDDLIMTVIKNDGTALLYSSFWGGSDHEWGGDMEIAGSYAMYFTGSTQSADYPVIFPYQSELKGISDSVIGKLTLISTN